MIRAKQVGVSLLELAMSKSRRSSGAKHSVLYRREINKLGLILVHTMLTSQIPVLHR